MASAGEALLLELTTQRALSTATAAELGLSSSSSSARAASHLLPAFTSGLSALSALGGRSSELLYESSRPRAAAGAGAGPEPEARLPPGRAASVERALLSSIPSSGNLSSAPSSPRKQVQQAQAQQAQQEQGASFSAAPLSPSRMPRPPQRLQQQEEEEAQEQLHEPELTALRQQPRTAAPRQTAAHA